ncbi:hypothetical protein MCUN1_001073 [Malassezia cuniculi]|uniref:Protein SGT1 n=1 Tax=Malassezia cuniculi TaxID=948313 RepID=A0AAF0EPK6_9BASI|nr:hypothetical protein MCUN1_001073 [Malassezia cuniculi]
MTIAQQDPIDEASERASVFEALLVPADGQTGDVALAASALQFIDDACKREPPNGPGGYLWHREAPSARIPEDAPNGAAMISMRIGDYVDDEWLVTGLLLDYSRLHPQLCIRVQDHDGEFLLIEAADELPTWLRPENAVNRVWLCNGHLHIVPLEYQSPGVSDDSPHAAFLSIQEAVAIVRSDSVPTQASEHLEEAAFGRVNFPASALAQKHTTLAYMPYKAARLLADSPQIVADAVHALTSGDVVSMRATQRLTTFDVTPSESFPPPNTVLVKVPMTRPLYAELAFSRFFPSRAFGKQWQDAVEAYRAEGKDVHGRWADTGAKLTAGLEMYAVSVKSRAKRQNIEPDASPGALEKFISSLASLGYFGDEKRDSARWKELQQAAIETARRAEAPHNASSDAYAQEKVIERGIQAECHPLNHNDPTIHSLEDSEDWLSVIPEQLEGLHGAPDDAVMSRLSEFMSRMGDFVNAQGDVEGAMFDDDEFDDESDDGAESEPEERPSKMSAAERERRMAELVKPLEASEWGEATMVEREKTVETPKAEPAAEEARMARNVPHIPNVQPAGEAPTRLQGLSQEHYDGASDSGESLPDDQDDHPEDREARAKWLGMEGEPVDDVDMDNEIGDFLEFARKTLGLSEEQYAKIIADHKSRTKSADEVHGVAQFGAAPPAPPKLEPAIVPRPDEKPEPQGPITSAAEREDARIRAQEYEKEMSNAPRKPNPMLNSFDAVLGAMEAELEAARKAQGPVDPVEDVHDDEITPEDAELLHQLLATGGSIPESLQRFADETGTSAPEVEMLRNFLESFKAQGSDAGPVGTLLGRLGVGALPRDTP